MKTTSEPLFSNKTELMLWESHNCDKCIKKSYLNHRTFEYTKFRCSIDRDICLQAAGLNEVNVRSFEAVQNADCPYIQTKRKSPKKRKIKNQIELEL